MMQHKTMEYTMQLRQNELQNWLCDTLNTPLFDLTALSGDASFRRYYRLTINNETRVVVDAPPEKEPLKPFVDMANLLHNAQVSTPRVEAICYEKGFAILEDFGDILFLNALTPPDSLLYYQKAIETLIQIQTADIKTLLSFNVAHMHNELSLFHTWFIDQYLKISLTKTEQSMIQNTFDRLTQSIAKEPQVFIHRDYHARNLMVIPKNTTFTLGVIDFQDAMHGPFAYDLASLVKDCYITLDAPLYTQVMDHFYQLQPLAQKASREALNIAVDECGLQRHLKVLGIFTRLYLRDHKTGYLGDLPRVMRYVTTCLARYESFSPLYQLFMERILPTFERVHHA